MRRWMLDSCLDLLYLELLTTSCILCAVRGNISVTYNESHYDVDLHCVTDNPMNIQEGFRILLVDFVSRINL